MVSSSMLFFISSVSVHLNMQLEHTHPNTLISTFLLLLQALHLSHFFASWRPTFKYFYCIQTLHQQCHSPIILIHYMEVPVSPNM